MILLFIVDIVDIDTDDSKAVTYLSDHPRVVVSCVIAPSLIAILLQVARVSEEQENRIESGIRVAKDWGDRVLKMTLKAKMSEVKK